MVVELGEKQHAAGWIGGFGYVRVDLGKAACQVLRAKKE
jgi:hypothetical protein